MSTAVTGWSWRWGVGEVAHSDMRQIGARRGNLGLTGGAVADTGVAPADRTGRAGAEANGATAGSAERQGIAALEASLQAMPHRSDME